jgi:hypothetical protein
LLYLFLYSVMEVPEHIVIVSLYPDTIVTFGPFLL